MNSTVAQKTKISVSELYAILAGVVGCIFISFRTNTPTAMNQYLNYWLVGADGKKTKNPSPVRNPYFDLGIRTIARKFKIVIGFDYENSVNGRLDKEGKDADFEASQNWIEHCADNRVCVMNRKDNSKKYLAYQYLDDSILECEYQYNGNPIEAKLFEAFKQAKSTYSNQGLDNVLAFQVVALDNIEEISIMGAQYVIEK